MRTNVAWAITSKQNDGCVASFGLIDDHVAIAYSIMADLTMAYLKMAYSIISGRCAAGGVLRLRLVRTVPSIIVMPTPGKLP
jgi:hypothetical protein